MPTDKKVKFLVTAEERDTILRIRAMDGPWALLSTERLLDPSVHYTDFMHEVKQTVAAHARKLIETHAISGEPVPPHVRGRWIDLVLCAWTDGESLTELGVHVRKLEKHWEEFINSMSKVTEDFAESIGKLEGETGHGTSGS